MGERFSDRRISRDIYQGLARLLREFEGFSQTSPKEPKKKAKHTNYPDPPRCNCLVIISVLGLSGYYHRANRQADKGEKILEGSEEFRYTI